MARDEVSVVTRISRETFAELQALAEREDRSLAWILREALRAHLERERQTNEAAA